MRGKLIDLFYSPKIFSGQAPVTHSRKGPHWNQQFTTSVIGLSHTPFKLHYPHECPAKGRLTAKLFYAAEKFEKSATLEAGIGRRPTISRRSLIIASSLFSKSWTPIFKSNHGRTTGPRKVPSGSSQGQGWQ